MKQFSQYADYLFYLSIVALILAAVSYLWQDIWLASTQWMVVSVVFAVYAIYLQLAK